jgi:hypothetical protein
MGCLEAGISTAVGFTVARAAWWDSRIPSTGVFLVVVRIRRLCAKNFLAGRLHRGIGWNHLDHYCLCYVDLASA